MRKFFLFFILTLIFFYSSCSKKEKFNNFKFKAVKVRTKNFFYKRIPKIVSIDGFVSSEKIAFITPKIDGYIEKINVKPGDRVKKGDVLLIIKNKEIEKKVKSIKFKLQSLNIQKKETKILINLYKKSLSQAEANFHLAKSNFYRYRNLLKTESITKEEFDKIHTQFINAELEVKKAKDLLEINKLKLIQITKEIKSLESSLEELEVLSSYRILKAPFSGIILEKYLDIGNYVTPGVKILKLGTLKKVAYFSVPLKYLKYCSVGNYVFINNKKAKIIEIIPEIEASQFKIKVSLNSMNFVNGQYLKAKFIADFRRAIVLPKNLVKRLNDLYYVYVCKNGFVIKTFLTGKFISNGFLVNSGLSQKDKVILTPINNFQSNLRCENKIK